LKYKILMPLFMLLSAFLLTSGIRVQILDAAEEEPSFAESISVTVNCTTAELTIFSTVDSIDVSLVHFPSEVNLNRSELIDAISIIVAFSRSGSGFLIVFNNTDAATARSLADTVKGSIENAFNVGFTWNITKIKNSYVYVEYIGPGKMDLTEYISWLMEKCLAPDLKGFTLTFLPMSSEEKAFVEVGATKESGSFNWVYFMTVGYSTSTPVGTGPHKIDILDLLNVESLTPSNYASYKGWFASTVQFIVVSNETVSFLSSEPGLVNPPTQLKGWLINIPTQPPAQLIAQFSFANDPTPVDRLSITFSGLIIPEFTAPIQLILLILAISVTLAARKRLRVSFK